MSHRTEVLRHQAGRFDGPSTVVPGGIAPPGTASRPNVRRYFL